MRYKKGVIMVLVSIFIIIGVQRWHIYSVNSIHTQISISDIECIRISGTAIKGDGKIATEDEMKNIVNWFNSISDIRENKDFQGTTEESIITILLKSKSKISIGRSGRNFEVQRYNKNGKRISYWGKQPDVEKILEEAAGK
jgi:hypothetical protein